MRIPYPEPGTFLYLLIFKITTMKKILLFAIVLILCTACGKNFLDVKPDKQLSIPRTISDLDALMNNRVFYARAAINLGIVTSDDYFVIDGRLETVSSKEQKNAYVYAKDIFEDEESNDWNFAYERILYANLILSHIDTISVNDNDQALMREIKGGALFHRASNHYQLLQLFCPQYDPESASHTACIPMRNDYDVSIRPKQGTVQEVYDFIISDLERSIELLPESNTVYRPSLPAAHLLLARIYLHLEKYAQAEKHADAGLQYRSELMDISLLDSNANYIFPADLTLHPEIILNHEGTSPTVVAQARQNISPELLAMFEDGDLRRLMYFRVHSNGSTVFRGSYRPSSMVWGGFTTNELWLIRAESRARLGDLDGALFDLNYLMKARYKQGAHVPISSEDPVYILKRVLQERRKDLILRGTRWEDLRRLNRDPRFAKKLVREIDGQRYELPINSPNWVFPIPKNELMINGWEQHSRE